MPEIIHCPQCQRQLRVPDELRGRSVKCPTCGEMFTAAAESAAPPPLESRDPPSDATRPEPAAAAPYRESHQGDELDFRRFQNYAPHRGTTILVFGILSLVVCGLLGPVAWIMGNGDLAEMRARRMDPSGEGMTQAGRICGIVATCLMALVLGVYCCIFGMMMMGGAGGAGGGGGFR